MAGAIPVPGYSNLRYVGNAAAKPAEQQLKASLLAPLNTVAKQLGVVFDIFSGSGDPSVRGAGFAGDPHALAIGADIQVNGQPVGDYPGAVAALHAAGLRSGATDFSYQGKPDPAHVDTLSASAASSTSGSTAQTADFVRQLLQRLGAPVTTANTSWLTGWIAREGTAARNNPLATTLRLPGSAALPGNSAGVQQYASPQQGVEATAQTLSSYPAIVQQLRTGNPRFTGAVATELGKWSGNSYIDFKPVGSYPWAGTGLGVIDTAVNGVQSTVGAVTSAGDFLGKLSDPSYILRGLQVIAGAVLVLVGIVLLTRQVALANDLPDPLKSVPVPV